MSYNQYAPIRDTPSPSFNEFEDKSQTASESKTWDRIIRVIIVIVVLCSIIDVICTFYLVASPFVKQRNGITSLDDLPYRSTYFKLDSLYSQKNRTTTLREPVINLPRVIVHVDSSKPTSVLPLWPKRWATDGGMVPYNERRVMITPHISTVAEFHVMDFGMEKCSLNFKVPLKDDNSHPLDEGISLDVWLLSWTRPVDTDALSWSTKPARQKRLGSFTLIANSTQQLPEYACNSGSYQIFELTCRAGDCNVEIAATMKQEIGLFLQQSQTI